MSDEVWRQLGTASFYGLAVSSALFFVLYMLLSPWWKTPTGRNIMALMGALAASACYFAWVIHQEGVPPRFYPIRFVLFTALFLAIAWRVVLFVRAQLLERFRPKGDENEGNQVAGDRHVYGDRRDGGPADPA
jgi:hypothetical protein